MTTPRPESEQRHDQGAREPQGTSLWVDFLMAGFPVTLKLTAPTAGEALDKLDMAIGWLRVHSDVETPHSAPQGPLGASQAAPSDENPPICSVHGPMKRSEKVPGAWFCPKKLASGGYCQAKFEGGKLVDPYKAA